MLAASAPRTGSLTSPTCVPPLPRIGRQFGSSGHGGQRVGGSSFGLAPDPPADGIQGFMTPHAEALGVQRGPDSCSPFLAKICCRRLVHIIVVEECEGCISSAERTLGHDLQCATFELAYQATNNVRYEARQRRRAPFLAGSEGMSVSNLREPEHEERTPLAHARARRFHLKR